MTDRKWLWVAFAAALLLVPLAVWQISQGQMVGWVTLALAVVLGLSRAQQLRLGRDA